MKLSKADLERLAAATSRFVKLPNAGWVELDTHAVQGAHEAMADMGVDGLIAVPQKLRSLGAKMFTGLSRSADCSVFHRRRSDFG